MVVSSNMLAILVSLFTGFILPKQLGVTQYAYYRIYCLYIAYAGVMHLGLVNGIYLKYGNYNKEELPIEKFRKFGRIMYLMQLAVVVILGFVLFAVRHTMDMNTALAYAFIIINIPLINIKWFYSSINQFTKRFIIDSYVTYLQNVLMLLMVVLVVAFHWYNFIAILIFTTLINLSCMLAVMMQNRTIAAGASHAAVWDETKGMIRSGFFLMLSEFVAIIILGIDSIFVQNLFSLEQFGMYSFAVSIISVIYSLIGTISNLIYPYLVRVEEEKYAEYYSLMSDVLSVVAIFSLAGYFAAKFIVDTWIQAYVPSLTITAVLFGTVVFRSLIMLVCGNYFKVLKMIKEYTKNNVFAIVISFVTDLLAYLIFHDYFYIAAASLVSFVIWYLVTDFIFIRRLQIPRGGCIRRYLCISLGLGAFYLLWNTAAVPAFFLYLAAAALICGCCFIPQFRKLLVLLKARRQ